MNWVDILIEAAPYMFLTTVGVFAGYFHGYNEGRAAQLKIQRKVIARLIEKTK